jgi:hypothetical protein
VSIRAVLARLQGEGENVMQYMLMIYDNEKQFTTLSEAERSTFMKEYGEFTQRIVKDGQFRAGGQLQPSSTATTVREKNGKPLTIDGPFIEAKEQLGGYYLVECKDLDEAIAIAKRIPTVRSGGSVEVRPLVPTSDAARTPPAR